MEVFSVLQVNDGTGDTMSPDGLSGVGSSGCSGFTGFFVDSCGSSEQADRSATEANAGIINLEIFMGFG